MERKLIILTNIASLSKVNEMTKNFENFRSLNDDGFLRFDNGILSKTKDVSEAEIIFVADRWKEDYETCQAWWDKFVTDNKAEDDEWYVIHHGKGIQPKEQKGIKWKEGAHVIRNETYGRVARILLDNEIHNKKDEIIKKIFGKDI